MLDRCLVESPVNQQVDPLYEFYGWLDSQLQDQSSRLAADQRYIDATTMSRGCFKESGFDVANDAELANLFFTRGNSVVLSGAPDSVDKLAVLEREEIAAMVAVQRCVDSLKMTTALL